MDEQFRVDETALLHTSFLDPSANGFAPWLWLYRNHNKKLYFQRRLVVKKTYNNVDISSLLNWFKDNVVNDFDFLGKIASRKPRLITYLQLDIIFAKYSIKYWKIGYDYLEWLTFLDQRLWVDAHDVNI